MSEAPDLTQQSEAEVPQDGAVQPGEGVEGEAEQPETATAAEDGEDGEHEGDEDEGQPKRRRPGKYQRTVQRLEAELREMRMALMQRGTGPAEPAQQPAVPAAEAPPKVEDFPDYEAYLLARAKYEVRQDFQKEARAAQERRIREQQQARQAEVTQGFAARVEAARDKYEDFDEVAFSPAVPVTPAMAEVIAESDMGPDVAYWLGKHPQEARRIAGLSPIAAAREIGKIEAKLSAPPPPKKTTAAPPPPTTVRGAAAPVVDPEKMSMDEWVKWRSQQLSASR